MLSKEEIFWTPGVPWGSAKSCNQCSKCLTLFLICAHANAPSMARVESSLKGIPFSMVDIFLLSQGSSG